MQYKILIVDDDIELQKMLKNFFVLRDFQVETASGGIEAVEKSKNGYDVIILDINMPEMDGMRSMQGNPGFCGMPHYFPDSQVRGAG